MPSFPHAAITAAETATTGRLFQPPKGHVVFDLDPGSVPRRRLRELITARPRPTGIVIDEAQRAPALLDVVDEQIESVGKRAPRFVLTGSSARKLRRSGVNLLAGRAVRTALHPFMAAELGGGFDLARALDVGLVPLVHEAADPVRTPQGYLSLYVREEVQAEGLVRDLGSFARFLEGISFSHASPLNLANVARECDVSRTTAEGYLGVLEDLLLAFQVPVFTRRAKRPMQAHPKLFWFDAGVFRSSRPAGPLDRPDEIAGPALEGLVAQHLRARIDYSANDCTLSYWRTKSGNEVDFVVYGRAGFWAIEVKNGRRVQSGDLSGLRAFREDYPTARVVVLFRGNDRLLVDGVPCLPIGELNSLRPFARERRCRRRRPTAAAHEACVSVGVE